MSGAIVVAIGGVLGAWSRWALAYFLNALWPSLPPGTLAVNLAGGYLIGFFIELFTLHGETPPEASCSCSLDSWVRSPRSQPFRPKPSRSSAEDNTFGRFATSPVIWLDPS
jgi:CrcB-like protein, Camphor Resistance (CrcB)